MLELLHAHPITNRKIATKELSNKQVKLSIFLFYQRFKTQYNMSGKKSRRIKEKTMNLKMRVAFQLEATKKEIIKKSETAEYLEQQVRLKAFHQGPPNFKLMYVFFLIHQVTL